MTPEQVERLLDFEQRFYKYRGTKERAIREELNMTPTQYYQRLVAALEHPHAHAYAPVLVNRLNRIRDGAR